MIYNFLPPDALDEYSLSIGRVKDMDLIIVDALFSETMMVELHRILSHKPINTNDNKSYIR